jgi:general nucleoside transport system ATP-binding protein
VTPVGPGTGSGGPPTSAVRLSGITKRFPGVVANDNVNLDVRWGEIHAVVGENGAGKSTLMKILYGMYPADSGSMEVDGHVVEFRSPREAIAAGIGMVHQHFMLADNFTVAENVVLGSEPLQVGGRIDFAEASQRIRDVGHSFGLDVEPDVLVETLGVGDRQRVEIIKILYRGARIVILDEPTAVLVPQEVAELGRNLRRMADDGNAVILIDHKLDEVLAVADRITVIRAGRTVATVDAGAVDARSLAELMVGSELPTPATAPRVGTDVVVLGVDRVGLADADGRARLADISLTVERGEIVGVAGVQGNGQSELVDALVGIELPTSGAVRLGDQDITRWSTRRRREAGMGYIPEDRQRFGLLLDGTIWENTMLGHETLPPFSKGRWIDRAGARRRTEEVIDAYDVRTPNIDVAAHALSGGNQQKLIVGRELAAEPRLLIAAHPTRGVDVGAQAAIWDRLRTAREAGMAILLLSADLDELIGLSDRLVVMLRGRIVAHVDPATVDAATLGSYMTGAITQDIASMEAS